MRGKYKADYVKQKKKKKCKWSIKIKLSYIVASMQKTMLCSYVYHVKVNVSVEPSKG